MFKKIIFLSMLLFSIENQPFFTELFAVVGFVACVRSKPVQTVARFAWSKYKGSSRPALPDFKMPQAVVKFAPGSLSAIKRCAIEAKGAALQNWSNLAGVLTAFKNRVKNPTIRRTESSQTTIVYTAQKDSSAWTSSAADGSKQSYWSSRFSNVYAQQNNSSQHNYGLFHWHGGQKSDEWAREFSKKRFWQGAFGGSMFTALALKSLDRKKEEKA